MSETKERADSLITSLSGVFLGTLASLRMWHWQTRCWGKHLAYEEAEKALRTLFDRFVEVYVGATDQRPSPASVEGGCVSIHVEDHANAVALLRNLRAFLLVDFPEKVSEDVFPHLLNLRDEMVEELDKLSYLLQLS